MVVPLRIDDAPLPIQDPRVWKGKKLFVDLDGTMVQCREIKDIIGYLNTNKTDERLIRTGHPTYPYYSVERVNMEAAILLKSLGMAGAMPVITSAGGGAYVSKVLETSRIIGSFYSFYAYEELAYLMDNAWKIMPKNYAPVISDLDIRNPEANCVIIGNEPRIDIPVFPQGVLTVLTTLDFSFAQIVQGFWQGIRQPAQEREKAGRTDGPRPCG
jgi:hypothetical protein